MRSRRPLSATRSMAAGPGPRPVISGSHGPTVCTCIDGDENEPIVRAMPEAAFVRPSAVRFSRVALTRYTRSSSGMTQAPTSTTPYDAE